MPTTKRDREAEKAAANSKGRAMLHSDGHLGNRHGSQRPKLAAPIEVTRAAASWAKAYLPGYPLSELERALTVVKRHPDQASRGYSQAKSARQRLELEINRQKARP